MFEAIYYGVLYCIDDMLESWLAFYFNSTSDKLPAVN